MEFILEVWQFEENCLFKLSWGRSNTLDARIAYPTELTKHYQNWITAYQAYYAQTAQQRGRPGIATKISAQATNWETRLNFTQEQLIGELRGWLRSKELFEIRQMIATAARGTEPIHLFIQCQDDPQAQLDDFSLAKLPWECLGQELSDRAPVHILRTTNQRPAMLKPITRSRLRVLAIFGDDTGLDFQAERDAIKQLLKPISYIEFAGHNISPKQPGINLKAQLRQAIADPQGWDILFFAGHSDESFGGELMLAPGYSAMISEFEESLKVARDRGLQFALFNSCRGCAIAQKLISYGLGHVVVMRERVTNEVAQIFFQQFAQHLTRFQDVQTAALQATHYLFHQARDKSKYPSAYLLPSIYAYVGVSPLKPPPWNWRVMLNRLQPTKREAIVLAALAILSCQTAVQYPLIDMRQLAQAIYREATAPIQAKLAKPIAGSRILLVKLDDQSLNAANIRDKDPIDRQYLAKLLQKAVEGKTPVVGVDYVLKDNRPHQDKIRQIVENPAQTQFVFAAASKWGRAFEQAVPLDRRIDGDIDLNNASNFVAQYPVFFARTIGDLSRLKPAAYPFPQQVVCLARQQHPNCDLRDGRAVYQPLSTIASWVGQQWLTPWIDYSIAPDLAYRAVNAQTFLQTNFDQLASVPQPPQILLFVPSEEFDEASLPMALRFFSAQEKIAGGEVHAYQIANLLQQGLIIPIPDLWMIGLVGLICKFSLVWLREETQRHQISRRGWIVLSSLPIVAYLVCLQSYIMIGVSVPILFPLLTYLSYLLPEWWRQQQRRSQLIK
jgi:hypothetical protein